MDWYREAAKKAEVTYSGFTPNRIKENEISWVCSRDNRMSIVKVETTDSGLKLTADAEGPPLFMPVIDVELAELSFFSGPADIVMGTKDHNRYRLTVPMTSVDPPGAIVQLGMSYETVGQNIKVTLSSDLPQKPENRPAIPLKTRKRRW